MFVNDFIFSLFVKVYPTTWSKSQQVTPSSCSIDIWIRGKQHKMLERVRNVMPWLMLYHYRSFHKQLLFYADFHRSDFTTSLQASHALILFYQIIVLFNKQNPRIAHSKLFIVSEIVYHSRFQCLYGQRMHALVMYSLFYTRSFFIYKYHY